MSSAVLTSPPNATARLVVDTDVASFIFKWHPVFAPRYVSINPWCRVDCLVHDIGGNVPRCAGRELGTTQVGLAGGISRGFFSPEFGQSAVFDLGSGSKREREERAPDERSRCVDRRHRSGSVRATGYKQRQRLPPLGQPPTRFRCRLNRGIRRQIAVGQEIGPQ